MTHATEKSRVGRLPFAVVKLSLDYCTLSYGRDACTAGRDASGTAQAGGANTITLAASDSYATNALKGFAVYISAGTGSGQEGRITANNATTKIATVSADWVTQPDATSQYTLINRPNACYNTRSTCQIFTSYSPSTTENEIWLTEMTADFPSDIWDEANLGVAVPALASISTTPPKIDIAGGLGSRATLKANCIDFPHHDRGLDKYVASRQYDPYTQGTFWGKFIHRNLYHQGRTLTYYDGYIVNGQFDLANFHAHVYIIEEFTGPDDKGKVSLSAKDVQKLADDNRSFAPAPSTGILGLALGAADTSLTLDINAGDSAQYAKSGTIRVNSEIMTFSDNSNFVLSGLVRAQWGTTADAHEIGDSVQLCITYNSVNAVDIVEDLYANYTNIPASYIPSAEWATEKTTYLSANTLTAVISEPTGVNELVKELVQENLMYMWWADVEQKIKLKAFAPISSTVAITDDANIVSGSMKVWHNPDLRVSQFWIYYALRDYTDEGTDNYRSLHIRIDTDTENTDKYGETRLKKIKSRWMDSSNAGLVSQITGRTIAMLSEVPHLAKFRLDAKDEDTVNVGGFITLTSRLLQNADGSDMALDMLIVEKRQLQNGTTYEYTAQEFAFTGNYAKIGPGTLPDYTGDTIMKEDSDAILMESGDFLLLEDAVNTDGATEAQKAAYAWIAPASGVFANGDDAYKIL